MFGALPPWQAEAAAMRVFSTTLQSLDPHRIIPAFNAWSRSIDTMKSAGDENWKLRRKSWLSVKSDLVPMVNHIREGKASVKVLRTYVRDIRSELFG